MENNKNIKIHKKKQNFKKQTMYKKYEKQKNTKICFRHPAGFLCQNRDLRQSIGQNCNFVCFEATGRHYHFSAANTPLRRC